MSSLRNLFKRREHKERSQPAQRKKHGLLEKHKDYVERARDYHKKQDYLNTLKKKAAFRNPDEFYTGMHKAAVINGVHRNNHDNSLAQDTVVDLKTQDFAYLAHKKTVDDKKAARLQSSLHLLDAEPSNKHTVFVDSTKQLRGFDAAEHFETAPALVGRSYNRPRIADLEEKDGVLGAQTPKQVRAVAKRKEKAYKELKARVQRMKRLDKSMQQLQTQRNLMGKGTKRKIETETGAVVYKWKKERSR